MIYQGKKKHTSIYFFSCLKFLPYWPHHVKKEAVVWGPIKWVSEWAEVAQSCLTFCNPMGYSPCNSPGQNTWVGSHSLLQGIFPTQGSNPGLLRCRRILYQLSDKGSPRILLWVAYPFSSGSSSPRNWTGVSCIAGGFFTNWAMREALPIE